jgi:hypothetical protein
MRCLVMDRGAAEEPHDSDKTVDAGKVGTFFLALTCLKNPAGRGREPTKEFLRALSGAQPASKHRAGFLCRLAPPGTLARGTNADKLLFL